MDFSNIANSVSVEKGSVLGRQGSILQMRSQNKVLILGLGDFAPTSKLRPGSTWTLLASIIFFLRFFVPNLSYKP